MRSMTKSKITLPYAAMFYDQEALTLIMTLSMHVCVCLCVYRDNMRMKQLKCANI